MNEVSSVQLLDADGVPLPADPYDDPPLVPPAGPTPGLLPVCVTPTPAPPTTPPPSAVGPPVEPDGPFADIPGALESEPFTRMIVRPPRAATSPGHPHAMEFPGR